MMSQVRALFGEPREALAFRRCFLLFSPDNPYMHLHSKCSSIAQSVVRRAPAAGGREREIDEVQRSEKRSGVARRFPGTANGSMTVNHDVVGSSPTGGAKTALAFADAFSFLG